MKHMVAADVNADGHLRLPKPVRKALHLPGKGGLVGFVIDGARVVLTRATVVQDSEFSDEELSSLARLSKHGTGKKTFRSKEAFLRYLWRL